MAEALARAALRAGVTGGMVHVIGAGFAGLSAALALVGPAGGSRCMRRGRRRAGAAGPISTASSAAGWITATTCCSPAIVPRSPTSTGSARATRWAVRARLSSRSWISRTGERWIVRPSAGRDSVVDSCRRRAGCRGQGRRLSCPAGTAGRARRSDGRRRCRPASLYRPAAGTAGGRGAEHAARGRARPCCSARWWTRRWRRAGRPASRWFPRGGLVRTLVDPALRLAASRGPVRLGRRIAALRIDAERWTDRHALTARSPSAPGRGVVLAVPALGRARPAARPAPPRRVRGHPEHPFPRSGRGGQAGFIGLIGGVAEWVFVKPGHVSVTISAANRMVDQPAERSPPRVWPDVRAALAPARTDAGLARGEGEARHLRRHPRAGAPAARRRAPTSRTSCWPAIGPPPACPAPSKVPSGPAAPPREAFLLA